MLKLFKVSVLKLAPQVDNQRSAEPVCRESPHPHSLNACLMGQIKFPKAVGIRIEFDPRCSTEKPQHCLTFADTKVCSFILFYRVPQLTSVHVTVNDSGMHFFMQK